MANPENPNGLAKKLRDRLLVPARKKTNGKLLEWAIRGVSRAGRTLPISYPMFNGIRHLKNIPYIQDNSRDHTLDIWIPRNAKHPMPVVMYIHGGAFRICSKESHWIMALMHAKRGFIVFNINYRLAPKNRFPAAVMDVAKALRWTHENAARFGGDPERITLAGESAGANLVTSLALAGSVRQEEPWAAELYDRPIPIRAVMAACGILQVTDSARFARRKPQMSRLSKDVLTNVGVNYLPNQQNPPGTWSLADPLVALEKCDKLDRPLPPFFAPAGTKDPILDDSRRLKKALNDLNIECEAPIYTGELHAFHAFVWRKKAKECWNDWFKFLANYT